MKTTGIVRRLDELGRIVIPREFRRLHRINVGDPLEIVAMENGNIIISKVDTISDLISLSETVCSSLSPELSLTVAASTFEKFVACTGAGKSNILDKDLPQIITKKLKNRDFFNGTTMDGDLNRLADLGFRYVCFAPIMGFDDCFGGIFAFSDNVINGIDSAALKIAGKLIGETLQKY